MSASIAVDWLTVTAHSEPRALLDIWQGAPPGWEPARPGPHYGQAIAADTGVRVEFGADGSTPQHGTVCIICDGAACQDTGPDALRGLARAVLASGGHATRLDVAADTQDSRIAPRAAYHALMARRATCPFSAPPVLYLSEGGDTLYLGAPSSDRRVRLYDKRLQEHTVHGVPLPDLPPHWVRLEVQLRRDRAQAAMAAWDRDGWPALAAEVAVVYHSVEPAWGEAFAATHAAAALPDALPRTLASEMDWIRTQVAPVLKRVRAGIGRDAYRTWLATVTDAAPDRPRRR